MKFATAALTALALMAVSGPAPAQHEHHQTPYAGMQQRALKSLNDTQIADLRAGRGMGLALAGELNGYPGPVHVLELADQLGLSLEQRQHVQNLFENMKDEAVPLGEKLIEQETALDCEFADQSISPSSLARLTAQIAETQGRLRTVHLKYHLTTAEILTAHQKHRYADLRGYR